jgi:hypothetical protein
MRLKGLNLFVLYFALCLCPACHNKGNNPPNVVRRQLQTPHVDTTARHALPPELLLPRNAGIDTEGAYSKLFLDSQAIASFISKHQLADSIAIDLRNFYNTRNYEFAWFTRDGLTEQALAFSSLYTYSKDSSAGRKWLDDILDTLMTRETLHLSVRDPLVHRAELLMTWRFINYLDDQYPDKKERSEVLLESIPAQKMNVLALARSLITHRQGRDSTTNPWYDALAFQLKGYLDSLEENDRDSLPKAHRHKTASIRVIKQRFPTVSAIRRWQLDHGLIPNGRIGPAFVKEYRVSLLSRIRKIVINLMRMRWMPDDNDRQLILVNIPDYRLHVLDSGAARCAGGVPSDLGVHPTSDNIGMNVVVGKAGHNTVLFSGYLDQIIFNPYWDIPPSIVQKEVLPAMRRDDQYLEEHDMRVTGTEKGVPVVRQLPGPRNELGRVKFLFPNSFNIYLHDSPHKDLFHQHRRAYSHGCIRVADAPGLAVWLLRNKRGWTKEKINKVIDEGKEKSVWVRKPVAVLICYFTAWVGEDGRLQFRQDIYGHDRRVAQHLFLD